MPVDPENAARLAEFIEAVKAGRTIGLVRVQLRGTDMEVDAITIFEQDGQGGVQIFPYGFMVEGPQIDAIIPPPHTKIRRQNE